MIIGCKKDLVDVNKTNFFAIDSKVKSMLKLIGDNDTDVSNMVDYISSGYKLKDISNLSLD